MSERVGNPGERQMDAIDRWYEENPDPTTFEVAGRLIPLRVRRVLGSLGEDLAEITEYLHTVWLEEAITLRQAAQIAVPAVHEHLQEQSRLGEMKAWIQACFFDHGLERGTAEKILRDERLGDALVEQEKEGAA